MTVFDPQAFVNTEMKGAIDTTIIPVPQGEYLAQVSRQPAFRQATDKQGNVRLVMDVSWSIDDENVKKVTKMDKPTCRQSVFCDAITDKDGTMIGIDTSKGKSRQLGLLREAVKQNTDGRPWSPAMLEGQVARIRVEHTPNKDDPDSPYANVTRVTSV